MWDVVARRARRRCWPTSPRLARRNARPIPSAFRFRATLSWFTSGIRRKRLFACTSEDVANEIPTIFTVRTNIWWYLNNWKIFTSYLYANNIVELTWLSRTFLRSHLALSGFRSLASTALPFFAAGTAKGPTPAKTSAIIPFSGANICTNRSCSVCRREFQ